MMTLIRTTLIRTTLLLAAFSFASPALASFISHIPSQDTVLKYGRELVDGSNVVGWLMDNSPYDFFSINVQAGQQFDFKIDETGGVLVPGLAIFEGIGSTGDTIGDLGPLVVGTDNGQRPNHLNFSWTPEEDIAATVVVSNQVRETGDYKMSVIDPSDGGGPEPEPVPEPASIMAWSTLIGIATIFGWCRRRRT